MVRFDTTDPRNIPWKFSMNTSSRVYLEVAQVRPDKNVLNDKLNKIFRSECNAYIPKHKSPIACENEDPHTSRTILQILSDTKQRHR